MKMWSLLITLVLVCIAGTAQAQITLTVGESGLVACGLDSQAKVVFWGVEWAPQTWAPRMTSMAKVAIAWRRGCASLEHSVPRVAVWVVVDLQTGAAAAGARSDFDQGMTLLDMEPAALQLLPKGDARGLLVEGQQANVLLIRPGVGAWYGSIADGGRRDSNGVRDDYVFVDPSDLEPVPGAGASSPADKLVSGDVVIAMSARGLQPLSLVVD